MGQNFFVDYDATIGVVQAKWTLRAGENTLNEETLDITKIMSVVQETDIPEGHEYVAPGTEVQLLPPRDMIRLVVEREHPDRAKFFTDEWIEAQHKRFQN